MLPTVCSLTGNHGKLVRSDVFHTYRMNLAHLLFVLCLVAVNFTSGCLAGLAATLASQPFDTLRTRLIGQGEPQVSVFMYGAQVFLKIFCAHDSESSDPTLS